MATSLSEIQDPDGLDREQDFGFGLSHAMRIRR